MPPYISPWALHRDQTGTRSADGAFALEYVEIVSLHVHGYYAMRWPTPGPPAAEACIAAGASHPPSRAEVASAAFRAHVAAASVMSFGQLGGLEIGVIDVQIPNQAGQVLTLVVTPPGAAAPTWTLSFLEQVRPEPHTRGKSGLGGDTSTFPELRLGAFLAYPGNRHSGYFALAQPTSPTSYLPSVFFVSDYDGAVSQITEAEFAARTTGMTAPVPPPANLPTREPLEVPPDNPTQVHSKPPSSR